ARLLRPGGVPAEAIDAILGVRLLVGPAPGQAGDGLPAPGMLPVHYAPRTPLVLVAGPAEAARQRLRGEVEQATKNGERVGLLLLEGVGALEAVAVEVVGPWDDRSRSAARLFDALRALDGAGLDVIFARELADPETGLGRALADRLRRAARRVVDSRA